jgi:3-hydroxyacyl-CoA dehydrogenase
MTARPKVALIGAGLIGRSWALVFARAGHPVALYDTDAAGLDRAASWLKAAGVEVDATSDLAAALSGAMHVQENGPERLDIKHAIYAAVAPHLHADAVVASSTSALTPDALFEACDFRARALVVHPTNPPHVLPAVELAASSWTAPEVLTRTSVLMQAAGQDPLVLKRVLPGFVVNRLQAALVNEAMALVEQGVADPEDIDIAVRSALGLRWAFIGPFETMDLNAAGGFEHYAQIFGEMFANLRRDMADRVSDPWAGTAPGQVTASRRATLPIEAHAARQDWRDAQVLRLRNLKNTPLHPSPEGSSK